MTDYAAIADRAVAILGGADDSRYQEAYTAMLAETAQQPVTGPVHENEVGMMSRLGVDAADAVLNKIEAAVPARVVRAIHSSLGINLSDPQTIALLDKLVMTGTISQQERDAVLAPIQPKTVPAWPDLKPGHVQNALQWRAAGRI